jgi:hypothetical protein
MACCRDSFTYFLPYYYYYYYYCYYYYCYYYYYYFVCFLICSNVFFLQCLPIISLRFYVVFVRYVTTFIYTVLCL